MPENNSSLETRSNEMEEVVGNVPSWIIRWGITVLFSVGVLGLIIAAVIRYPDTLKVKVLVKAVNQPGRARIRKTEENAHVLFKYNVRNGEKVAAGDTLLTQYDPKTNRTLYTTTPMAGTIYIANGVDEKNTLDQFIWVVPQASNAEIEIKYSSKGAGNVKVGQKVRMTLSDYPSTEYGFLEGRISQIHPVVDGEHQASVELMSKKLLTSENKEIPVLPVMEGDGDVLLSDRSIFQRIFGSVFH